MQGRALAKVKRSLCESEEGRRDVVIVKRKGEVYAKKERVAKWDGHKLRLRGEVEDLWERIEELISEGAPEKDGLSDE